VAHYLSVIYQPNDYSDESTIVWFARTRCSNSGPWVAAGETAAWRLKWISIPVMFVTLFVGVKIYRSIRFQPDRFCGIKYGTTRTARIVNGRPTNRDL
jgi:hypothetical protein